MEAFERSLKTIIDDDKANYRDCKSTARHFLPAIRTLLTEHKRIFEGIDIDEAWANDNREDIFFAVESGLYSFIEPDCVHYSDKVSNASKILLTLVKKNKRKSGVVSSIKSIFKRN